MMRYMSTRNARSHEVTMTTVRCLGTLIHHHKCCHYLFMPKINVHVNHKTLVSLMIRIVARAEQHESLFKI